MSDTVVDVSHQHSKFHLTRDMSYSKKSPPLLENALFCTMMAIVMCPMSMSQRVPICILATTFLVDIHGYVLIGRAISPANEGAFEFLLALYRFQTRTKDYFTTSTTTNTKSTTPMFISLYFIFGRCLYLQDATIDSIKFSL